MRVLVLFALCASISSISALKYISEKYEAVVIVSDNDPDVPTIEYLPEGTTLTPVVKTDCKTQGGVNGRCIPYDTCYPYGNFFMGEIRSVGDEYQKLKVFEELNSTESCVPTGDLSPGSEAINFICCPAPEAGLGVRDPENEPESDTPPPTKVACGQHYENLNKVVGGRPASPGEFPWAVALIDGGRQFCGGSLISASYVLTAAHCVQGMQDTRGLKLQIGDHDWSTPAESKSETRSAVKVMYHKDFRMSNLNNDVALIKLDRPVALNGGNIVAVCLNNEEVPEGDKADLAGWGKQGANSPPSRTLKTVRMRVNTHEECRREYQGTQAPPITSGMICAGEKSPALKDACNGDSGGPLTYAANGSARQIGIVSWGIGCGQKYGVYTNVKQYVPWIQRNSLS